MLAHAVVDREGYVKIPIKTVDAINDDTTPEGLSMEDACVLIGNTLVTV